MFLPILIGSVAAALLLVGGVRALKIRSQRDYDADRRTYILTFPADLDVERVYAWLRSISGTLSNKKFRFTGTQTVVFETWSDSSGITHRLKVPWQQADYIVSQLRALAPGINATPDKDFPTVDWTAVVEIGESTKSRPLRVTSAKDVSTSILSAVQPLKEDEIVVVQWVLTPATLQPLPRSSSKSDEFSVFQALIKPRENSDAINERRAKLSEPNFMGVLRVGAKAESSSAADHLIFRVRSAFATVNSPHNHWYVRAAGKAALKAKLNGAAGVYDWSAQLSISETGALISFPIGSPSVSGLPRGASRQLPANQSVPSEGIVIATSTFPGAERPIAISHVGGLQHTLITGGTGSGKSALMANMAAQDMAAGHTVIVLEPKGDLFYETLARVPADRVNDVIVIDLQDTAYPVGFNILQQGNPRIAVSNLKSLFESFFPDIARATWARAALHRGMQTLITDPRSTFPDIVPLFSPMSRSDIETDWKEHLVRGLSDYDLELFWQRFNNLKPEAQERYAAPLTDRAWIITETPEVRNVFGQSTSSFTFEEVLDERKIVLINLSGVGEDVASLTGTMFLQAIWSAVQSKRGNVPAPAYLYMDEFQSFMKLPISTDEMLAKSRSFKLGMRLAHQHLDQLNGQPEMRAAVMNNARNKIIFQAGSDDATKFAREFGSLVSPNDFQNLRQFEVLARVVTDEGVSHPLSARTNSPRPMTGKTQLIRSLSRDKYGRPVDQVMRDMRDRRKPPESATGTNRRPPISGEGWS